MGSPKSVRLANEVMNTAEIRIAAFTKAVIKYQGKHLPRNTSNFFKASATKKSPDEVINWV